MREGRTSARAEAGPRERETMNVLVINAGSSSLKYQLLDVETAEVYAKGNCERIGIDGSFLTHSEHGGETQKTPAPFPPVFL